ncbi:MAG TPA: endopeptidase La [Abditibacteriaceae bacterium]|jgi:ATP-dependent Lon protease
MAENTLPPIPETLPVVATTNLVIYPFMMAPLTVGRPASLAALDAALEGDRLAVLTLQRDENIEQPTPDELHTIGCACAIVRMMRSPDGAAQVIVQGLSRVRISEYSEEGGVRRARVETLPDSTEKPLAIQALMNNLLGVFRRIVELSPVLPDEMFAAAQAQDAPGKLADFVASTLNIQPDVRQEILAELDVQSRMERVTHLANNEVNVLEISSHIQSATRQELDKGQREYILRQQLREIQKELGEGDDRTQEIEELRRLIEEAGMTEEAHRAADRELERLSRMPQAAAEYSVVRNYLDYLIAIPWSKRTHDNLDITHAEKVLNDEHYGLQDVKERVLEYLAVRRLNPNGKGPILCFVGPPGVGKTSLAHSIAHALGRKFVRMALGGVRDEAEIRGHRRTYIGAMPGRIAQGLRDAGTNNPVMILDEIDKLGADYRGDPTSALLEVLDPQQNNSFKDHYLEVPLDLSQVIFITTANVLETIPGPLRDRMEVLRIAGYTEEEKVHIAKRHLLPRQMQENGLSGEDIWVSQDALRNIVRGYTREAGVRNLEREIANVCRKVARKVAEGAPEENAPLPDVPEPKTEPKAESSTQMDAISTKTSATEEDAPATSAATPLKSAAELAAQKAEHALHDGSSGSNGTAQNGVEPARPAATKFEMKRSRFRVTPYNIEEYLGPTKYQAEMGNRAAQVGVATGMAWTPVGGEVLFIESAAMPGKRGLSLTGQLGEVMKESAQIALDYLRSHTTTIGVPQNFGEEHDIHIHVPAGAIPKDGPSAGVAMTVALASLMSGRPARHDIAMTGEVTLTGRVLPIGGVKEKVLAARQAGIKTIILPERNRADVREVPEEARVELKFEFVDDVKDAVNLVLLPVAATDGSQDSDSDAPDVTTPLEQDTAEARL